MGRSTDTQPVVLLWGLTLGATVKHASALRAAIEEKDLAQRFGEEYREYRARTPFLVGLPPHGGKGRTRRREQGADAWYDC